MKIAVFGDVHGNLPALEAMLNDAGVVDGYICLGDMVDYGPWSNECVELITRLPGCVIIQGNHERYFLDGRYGGNNAVTQQFFDVCIKDFKHYRLIEHLPDRYAAGTYVFTHTINNETIYPDSDIRLDTNYVIGHSHHQFTLRQGTHTLHNAGSVGQNRRYINEIDYLLYDPDSDSIEQKHFLYDERPMLDKMNAMGYPQVCIEYYRQKKRKE